LRPDELSHDAAVAERFDRRNALDPVRVRGARVRIDVKLGQLDGAIPPGDLALQDRCQHSARTAPCGPEVDDDRDRARALDDGGLECRVCDVH